jgi:predicted ATPase
MVYRQQAELQTSYEVAKQLLVLAEKVQTPEFLVAAHQALGTALYFLGEFAHARTHLEQGVALYDPRQHASYAIQYGQDPGVICLSTLARALWALGYPDRALQRSHEALTLAQQLFHPFSLTFALYFGSVVHQYRREWREVQNLTGVMMELSTKQGFVQRVAQGRILLGWTLVEQGQVAEGIAQMRRSVAAYGATGADLGRSSYLALLAEAYAKEGQIEEGLTVVAGALTAVYEHRICFNEAELHRLKGDLLLRQAMGVSGSPVRPATEAEVCLRHALAVARRQEAKALELRAAMSLSRLWQRQGKRHEARELLAPIYGWFTEGFDTADLQEATALLEELA